MTWTVLLALLLLSWGALGAQMRLPLAAPAPALPPGQTFHDSRFGVMFEVPKGWNLNRRDGEVSTFNLDARTATREDQMRAVASIGYNPFPRSTFSGAYVYLSVAPRLGVEACTRQASAMAPRTVERVDVAGLPFTHGYDEHGRVCTESRDEVYTASRANSCYRFDLVINTFCGGEVSGVRDITEAQLEVVRQRLEGILESVHFDGR